MTTNTQKITRKRALQNPEIDGWDLERLQDRGCYTNWFSMFFGVFSIVFVPNFSEIGSKNVEMRLVLVSDGDPKGAILGKGWEIHKITRSQKIRFSRNRPQTTLNHRKYLKTPSEHGF